MFRTRSREALDRMLSEVPGLQPEMLIRLGQSVDHVRDNRTHLKEMGIARNSLTARREWYAMAYDGKLPKVFAEVPHLDDAQMSELAAAQRQELLNRIVAEVPKLPARVKEDVLYGLEEYVVGIRAVRLIVGNAEISQDGKTMAYLSKLGPLFAEVPKLSTEQLERLMNAVHVVRTNRHIKGAFRSKNAAQD